MISDEMLLIEGDALDPAARFPASYSITLSKKENGWIIL